MKKSVCFFVFLLALGQLFAQQQVQTSLYYFNTLGHNPAYTGTRDALAINLAHRNQWAGVNGAPQTTFLNIHTPIKGTQLSIGADLMHDEIGVSKTTAAYLDLAYYVQLDDKGNRLSFGLKGGFNIFDLTLSELNADPDVFKQDVENKWRGNFGAGIYYYGQRHFIGLSALSLLKNSVLDSNTDIELLPLMRHYYLTGAYVFDISPSLKLRPTALVKIVEGTETNFDGELAAILYDKLFLGVGYRHDVSVRGYLIARLTPQLSAGYNYEYIFNDLGKYTGGTHEFMLSYDFEFNKKRYQKAKYF